mmetsp:Transcript_40829/g.121888  ORF Transcript_40829/g.121888 Transcript_40829/m.121888 type:complete len:247 (-) Transcript_40829:1094-1834(-)|eukprot:317999-Chlamydomonas_euryale.AAC.3
MSRAPSSTRFWRLRGESAAAALRSPAAVTHGRCEGDAESVTARHEPAAAGDRQGRWRRRRHGRRSRRSRCRRRAVSAKDLEAASRRTARAAFLSAEASWPTFLPCPAMDSPPLSPAHPFRSTKEWSRHSIRRQASEDLDGRCRSEGRRSRPGIPCSQLEAVDEEAATGDSRTPLAESFQVVPAAWDKAGKGGGSCWDGTQCRGVEDLHTVTVTATVTVALALRTHSFTSKLLAIHPQLLQRPVEQA